MTVPSMRDDVGVVTPVVLRWQYSTFAYVPTAPTRNVPALAGYTSEYLNQADSITFMRKYRSDGIDFCMSWLISTLYQPTIPQTITPVHGNYEKIFPMDYVAYVRFLFAQLGTVAPVSSSRAATKASAKGIALPTMALSSSLFSFPQPVSVTYFLYSKVVHRCTCR